MDIQKWMEELRPAQVESIKEIRQTSNHLIICSPTASGKTEAAMLPLISELLEKIFMKNLTLFIFLHLKLLLMINLQDSNHSAKIMIFV